jgi:dihydroorotase
LGRRVTTELTPQHLLLHAPDCYEELGSRAMMNPPIREESHRRALWQAFQDGLIHVLGSDHAPHTIEQKGAAYLSCPSGMPGTETLLPLMLDQVLQGKLRLEQLVAGLAEGPAQAFGMEGKGCIEPGARGDFTVLDPDGSWLIDEGRLQSRCGWSPFHGRQMRGRVSRTIIRGRTVYCDGELQGPARGRALEFTHSR